MACGENNKEACSLGLEGRHKALILSTVGALVGSVMLKQRTQVSKGSHKVSQ